MSLLDWLNKRNFKVLIKKSEKHGWESAKTMFTSMIACGLHNGADEYSLRESCLWLISGRPGWRADISGLITYNGFGVVYISDIITIEELVNHVVSTELADVLHRVPEHLTACQKAGCTAALNYVTSHSSRVPFKIA